MKHSIERRLRAFAKKMEDDPARALAGLSLEDATALLAAADDMYYNHGTSPLTDAQYDALKEHAERRSGAAAAKVGAPIPNGRDKVTLPYWLGSLNKVKTVEAIERWGGSGSGSGNGNGGAGFVVSDKLDGISGLFLSGSRLYTRGNGQVGENISKVVGSIAGLPRFERKDIAVRGELIVARKDVAALRKVVDFKNARNLVAGALNSKTPNPDVLRFVRFVAYEAITDGVQQSPKQQLALLKRLGFQVPWHERVSDVSTLAETLSRRRAGSEFDVDGLVVFKDAPYLHATGSNPNYAVAFKSTEENESARTTVTGVTWAVSKHNFLKPTVLFEPVELSGVTIQKATGFNAKFVVDNGIGPGAVVRVIRSGDVIPFIEGVERRSSAPSLPPDGTYEWTESRVDIVAVGSSDEHEVAKLVFFFEALGAKGVSRKTIVHLYSAGYRTVRQLLDAAPEDIAMLDGMGDRAAEIVTTALRGAVQRCTCVQLMAASSAFGRGIGERRIRSVYEALGGPSLRSMLDMRDVEERVRAVPGMGDVTASLFAEGIKGFAAFVRENRLSCGSEAVVPVHWTVCFTGFRDADLERRVKQACGSVSGGVTSKTDVVVAGGDKDEDTGKLRKARQLGIRVMDREEFDAYLAKERCRK
jgi:DNA ligase (NAD+)